MGKKEEYSIIKIISSIPIQEYCQEEKLVRKKKGTHTQRCYGVSLGIKRVCIKMKDDI
jgi:hypothetical protein